MGVMPRTRVHLLQALEEEAWCAGSLINIYSAKRTWHVGMAAQPFAPSSNPCWCHQQP